MRRIPALLVAAIMGLSPAVAQDCSSSVSSAQNSARQTFIQGMAGLASNSFSSRPSSFSSMACLDKFMQGNMDIMFKPPSLNDLLGQVLNFACQSSSSGSSSSGSMPDLGSLIGSLSGGLNVGGSSVNLGSMLGNVMGGGGSSFGGAFGGGNGGGYSGGGGGLSSLYTVRSGY